MKRVSFQRTLMRQSITGYLILLGALLLYSFFQTVSYGRGLYESNRRVFNLYLEEINQATRESELFILNLYSNNAYTSLAVSTDVLKKYGYAYDIRQIFQIQMNYENSMEGLFLRFLSAAPACAVEPAGALAKMRKAFAQKFAFAGPVCLPLPGKRGIINS